MLASGGLAADENLSYSQTLFGSGPLGCGRSFTPPGIDPSSARGQKRFRSVVPVTGVPRGTLLPALLSGLLTGYEASGAAGAGRRAEPANRSNPRLVTGG